MAVKKVVVVAVGGGIVVEPSSSGDVIRSKIAFSINSGYFFLVDGVFSRVSFDLGDGETGDRAVGKQGVEDGPEVAVWYNTPMLGKLAGVLGRGN